MPTSVTAQAPPTPSRATRSAGCFMRRRTRILNMYKKATAQPTWPPPGMGAKPYGSLAAHNCVKKNPHRKARRSRFANPLKINYLGIRHVSGGKTGRLGLQNSPYCIAKRTVSGCKTASTARPSKLCKQKIPRCRNAQTKKIGGNPLPFAPFDVSLHINSIDTTRR